MLSRNGLLRALVDAKDNEAWFDIESTMMHYIRKQEELHEAYGYPLASTDREEYQVICSAMKEYLSEESETFHMKNNSVAERAFKDLMEVGLFHKIYTFNYTDINDVSERLDVHAQTEVCHVHGSLAPDDNIILGVEGEQIIPEPYKFMYKSSSRYYRSNNLYEDLNILTRSFSSDILSTGWILSISAISSKCRVMMRQMDINASIFVSSLTTMIRLMI